MRQSQNVAEQGEMQCFDNSPSHPSPSHNNHHSTHGENSDIISKIQIWKWVRNKMTLNSCTYQQFFPATNPRSWQMDAKLTFLVSSYPNPVIFGIMRYTGLWISVSHRDTRTPTNENRDHSFDKDQTHIYHNHSLLPVSSQYSHIIVSHSTTWQITTALSSHVQFITSTTQN